MIKYELPVGTKISLKTFNVLGQVVVTLADEFQQAGYKSIEWNAANVPSGVYLCRLQSDNFLRTLKLILLK